MAFEKETRKTRGPAKSGSRGGAGGGGKKTFGDKPRSSSFGDKPRGPKKDFGDRPKRDFGDRPPRREGASSEDRPKRSYSRDGAPPKRDFGDRPKRDFGDSPRPPRREGSSDDRPKRSYSRDGAPPKRDFGDRPRAPRGDFGDRPPRREGSSDDRPKRSYSRDGAPPKRDYSDRPKRDFGDSPRPPRREGSSDDRPRRSYDDKPRAPRGDFGDRPPRKDFGDKPRAPRGDFGDRPRAPRRDSEERPPRRDYSRASDAPRAPRKEFTDRPPRRDYSEDRPPRRDSEDRPPRKKYDDDFKPRARDGFEKRPDDKFAGKPRAEKVEPIKGHELMFYGVHAVHAALRNPARKVVQIWVTESGQERLNEAWDKQRHPHPEVIERRELDNRLTAGAVHQGLAIAVEPLQDVFLTDIMNAAHAANAQRHVVVVLDEVTDPHNVGAVLRSMSAFGAQAMIVHKRNAPGVTGVMAKIATGAVETIPMVAVTNISQAMTELKNAGFFVLGLDENADYPIQKAPTTGNVALVLGAEGEGLRALTRTTCDAIASIETFGDIKSLNVSNAAAIALYALTQK